MPTLNDDQIAKALPPGWWGSTRGLYVGYSTGDFNSGHEFVGAIAEAADAANHHPDVLLTYPRVDIRLISHDVGAVSDRDLSLARHIADLAARWSIEPGAVDAVLQRTYESDSR